MQPNQKRALRAAILIHEQLAGGPQLALSTYLPDYAWNRALRVRRQIERASQRGWHGAAAQLAREWTEAIEDCRRHLDETSRELHGGSAPRPIATAVQLYQDLRALEGEFAEVVIDLAEYTVSATTAPIVLEDIPFGPFEIRLDWHRLQTRPPYQVIARQPHPATRDDEITHPHVQAGQLCEGEGRAAVAAALAEGRLLDFFLLVDRILHSYGRGSAYVELDDWHGMPCNDCGATLREEDRCDCSRCEVALCDRCATPCATCGETFCGGCISRCAVCQLPHCGHCLRTCSACRRPCCDDCRDEEDHCCTTCHDQRSPSEEHAHAPSPSVRPARPAAVA